MGINWADIRPKALQKIMNTLQAMNEKNLDANNAWTYDEEDFITEIMKCYGCSHDKAKEWLRDAKAMNRHHENMMENIERKIRKEKEVEKCQTETTSTEETKNIG